MAELELALAASARDWSDGLHRFLVDHGGARVRTVVMTSEEAESEEYDALLIDDVCSFLSPRLVDQVRRSNRYVVGVFEPQDGEDAKKRLLECGVDDVVEASASPAEFLEVVNQVRRLSPLFESSREASPVPLERGRLIAVGGPHGGVGATEISVALASTRGDLLVDCDDVAPALAQRLGLALHPNIRSAVDVLNHRAGDPADAIQTGSGLQVLAGLAHGGEWEELRPVEVEALVMELATTRRRLILNIGSGLEPPQVGEGRHGLARSVLRRADAIVAVGSPTPVGIGRLLRWVEGARLLAADTPLRIAINRIGKSPYRRSEIAAELASTGSEVFWVPDDPRVPEAAWAGKQVGRGPFSRSVRKLAVGL